MEEDDLFDLLAKTYPDPDCPTQRAGLRGAIARIKHGDGVVNPYGFWFTERPMRKAWQAAYDADYGASI